MAFDCCAADGFGTDADFLGASGLVVHRKNHIYGSYLLYSGTGLYLRQYPLWNFVRCDDAEYRGAGKDQHVPFRQCNDRHRHYQHHNGSPDRSTWKGE